jgi:hypothetical protein
VLVGTCYTVSVASILHFRKRCPLLVKQYGSTGTVAVICFLHGRCVSAVDIHHKLV